MTNESQEPREANTSPPIGLEQRLLAHVNQPNYQPVKPRVIAKKLGLNAEQAIQLRRAVKKLVQEGKIGYGSNHLVKAVPPGTAKLAAGKRAAAVPPPPADKKRGAGVEQKPKRRDHANPILNEQSSPSDSAGETPSPAEAETERLARRLKTREKKASGDGKHVTGVYRRTQSGFGFVRPSTSTPADERTLDVFIPADKALDAVSGDTVLVRVSSRRDPRRPNRIGEITEVIERDSHQFVGTYFESAGTAYVEVDGAVFGQPVRVGDPGAKNARTDDKVVFEMVVFPSQTHEGEGVITEVLGPRGAPGVDTLSIIREYNLPEDFALDTLAEARLQADRFDENDLSGRTDLTGQTIITIDPVDARDFDDAISLERVAKDHWRLGVHIADVSHFVQPGTALDREAHDRGTSVYLPDRVIPMIPEIISNGLASLQPDRVRFTKTVFIEFTPDGVPVGSEFHSAAIRSVRRFAYEEVDEYLADPEPWKKKLTPRVHSLLERMHELAMILRNRRLRKGALELTMPEVKIDLDRDGRISGAHVAANTVSHQIIEEFMLAANVAAAEKLREEKLHFLRRVHSPPDPRKLKLLTAFVAGLGFAVESLESRFELQRLLALVEDRPERQAINYAALRSLQRAVYSPADEGHYALAFECYTHFTSPIRRYPDLHIHRLLQAVLMHQRPKKNDLVSVALLGEHCSTLERRAEAAERELIKVKLLAYLQERIGEEFDAVITGVETFGLFAQGIEMPAEGLIHVTSLTDDYYRYDKSSHSLNGHRAGNQFRLGDTIRVSVARVDIERRALDFRLVQRGPAAPRPRAEKPARRKPGTSGGKPPFKKKKRR
ncbi:MAG: ribonuclease R [Pirellulales bacterium]